MEGYRINMELTLEESLERIFLLCISYVRNQIDHPQDMDIAVHEARRTYKRIRALLRMIRDEIGYSDYYRENTCYRDLSARLSPLRDSYVLRRTMTDLHTRFPEEFPEKETRSINDSIQQKCKEYFEDFTGRQGGFDRMKEDLDQAVDRVHNFCKLRNEFRAIRKGIRRTYSRGHRYLRIVQKKYEEEQFHEYRKNTKYLLHQMELIQPVYPRLIKAYAGTMDKHSEILGDTRDYLRLENYIRERSRGKRLTAGNRKMIMGISLRREEMMQNIIPKANRIYAEKPREIIKRLDTYWSFKYT